MCMIKIEHCWTCWKAKLSWISQQHFLKTTIYLFVIHVIHVTWCWCISITISNVSCTVFWTKQQQLIAGGGYPRKRYIPNTESWLKTCLTLTLNFQVKDHMIRCRLAINNFEMMHHLLTSIDHWPAVHDFNSSLKVHKKRVASITCIWKWDRGWNLQEKVYYHVYMVYSSLISRLFPKL